MTSGAAFEKCATCYGEGVVGGTHGPAPCSDCLGLGLLPSATVLMERRLRELEESYARRYDESSRDVEWLVGRVRQAHHALLKILAASQDADDEDPRATQIRHLANDVLGVYPPAPA